MSYVDPMLLESSRERHEMLLRKAEAHRLARVASPDGYHQTGGGRLAAANTLVALARALRRRYQPAES